MIISHSKKFIFIHNYKVAGSSITQALDKYAAKSPKNSSLMDNILYKTGIYPGYWAGGRLKFHIKANELKEILSAKVFDSYYKFGFVRNPWDWQVSLYNYGLSWELHHQRELFKSFKSFDEYIEWRVNHEVRLQKDFFYDSAGKCLMNFIGKFETINEDFNLICRELGINVSLPHINKREDDKKYLSYYSSKSIDMIFDAYNEDILTFKYGKPVIAE